MIAQAIQALDPKVDSGSLQIPDPVDWIEANFWAPETKGPIHLAEYQKRALREALSTDEAGHYKYSVILWSDIKKSIKSTIAAAVGLWMAWHAPWSSVKVIANDLKQADSRVAYYMRRSITLNPEMSLQAKVKPSGYTITLANNSRIEAIPIDPKGEAGGNDDMIIFSELWAANQKAAQLMWAEMTLSPTKFGKSFRWIETYAGYTGEAPILEQLHEQGVKEGKQFDWAKELNPPLAAYHNPTARLFCMWNNTPRLEWQTPEYYAQESAVLTDNDFRRVHRNEWVSSADAFIPPEWWDACRHAIPPLDKRQPLILVADASVSGDSYGVLMLSGAPDGVSLVVRYARAWRPPRGGKLDYQGTPENPGPELEIRRLVKEYNVAEFTYDPYQLEDLAGRLRKDLIVHIYAFSQGQERLVADKALQDLIRARRIWHGGEADLGEHVKNANAKSEGDATKLRIVKRSEKLKVDLCVCLSMAAARAIYWQI